jgi:putative ABC transport system ATP-binding protein
MAAIIQALGLTKDFHTGKHQVRAIDHVSLTVEPGELVAVMGPSGSGKSSLLYLLGCLDRPTSGAYRFRGQPVIGFSSDRLAELRNRHIGFVFQSFNLLPRASALDNVALPLLYAGVPTRERRARGQSALERVGLGDRLGHAARELSGGEQQRVALARGLVNDPDLILADEPTGALDSRTGRDILALLQELNANGVTVLIVTHDQGVAAHAQRLLEIRDGRLARDRPNPHPLNAGPGLVEA